MSDFRISGIELAHVRAVLRAMRRIQFSPAHRAAAESYAEGPELDEVVRRITDEADRLLPEERARAARAA